MLQRIYVMYEWMNTPSIPQSTKKNLYISLHRIPCFIKIGMLFALLNIFYPIFSVASLKESTLHRNFLLLNLLKSYIVLCSVTCFSVTWKGNFFLNDLQSDHFLFVFGSSSKPAIIVEKELSSLCLHLQVVIFCFSKNRCDKSADSLSGTDLTSSSEKSEIRVFCDKAFSRLKGSDRNLPQV